MNAIGKTPLIKLEKLSEPGCAEIYVKYEGANVWAAIQRARIIGEGKRIVTIIVDSGLKYLDGDLYKI